MEPFAAQPESPDDHYRLECFSRDRTISINGDIFRDVSPILKDLLDDNKLCDGIIRTDDNKTFKVHCILLSCISPYFRTSFTNMAPAAVREIDVPYISSRIMGEILKFAYSGEVAMSIDNVEDLIVAATTLQVPEIVKMCLNFMSKHLTVENCINTYTFAKQQENLALTKICRQYILSRFHMLFSSETPLVVLSASDIESLLGDDALNVWLEETVFNVAVRWTEDNYHERKKYFPRLFNCVRSGLCSREFFTNVVETHPFILDNEDCQPALYAASMVFTDIQAHPEISPIDMHHPLLRPRIPQEIIFVVGGWGQGSATNVMETYDVRSNRWFLSFYSDNLPRAYHGLGALYGLIYMIGGFDGNQCYNTVRCFDPTSYVWCERACMYTARCYVSVAVLEPYIYAMGGYDSHMRVRTAERYDPSSNQWSMISSMIFVRSDASASVLHDKVYIVGGFNGQQVLSTAERYDPVTDVWTEIREMSSPRSGVNLIEYQDCLYVIGGFNGTNRLASAERYDIKHNMWFTVAPMVGPRSNFATAVVEDCLYVMGGFNGLTTVANVERYEYSKNIWIPVSGMSLNRSALSACVLQDLPNAKEYSFLGSLASN